MDITIKKLSLNLIDDYLDFFDNRAFTDNKGWSLCYCTFYHWNDKVDKECTEDMNAGGMKYTRNYAIKLIREGTLQGYLAYVDGVVVGWCNANAKSNLESLDITKRPELWDENDTGEKIKSVVCYTIAPDFRRKGIATQMLEMVCADAKEEGYTLVEAYPGKSVENIHRNYHGPFPLYEKCGFSLFKDLEKESIVRKYL